MATDRPDLDGLRLTGPDQTDVWLVFHGRRHRIASPQVYDSLFSGTEAILLSADLEAIAEGPVLDDGACLVRPDGELDIYLATGAGEQTRLFHVPTYESLLDFDFDEAKVHTVPRLIVEAMPAGEPLESAPDRAARQGLPAAPPLR